MDYCILRKQGKIYRIKKAPFETNEQAMDRLWFLSSHQEASVSDSLKWVYQKYLKVKY